MKLKTNGVSSCFETSRIKHNVSLYIGFVYFKLFSFHFSAIEFHALIFAEKSSFVITRNITITKRDVMTIN